MELSQIIQQELQRSKGYSDELSARRAESLKYYKGEMPLPPEEGSKFTSMDVADGVHAIMASLEPLISSTNIEFRPNSPQDEEQAQIESDSVRSIIHKYDGFEQVFSALHDALMVSNGWVAVEEEVSVRVQESVYPKLTSEQIYTLFSSIAGDHSFDSDDEETTITLNIEEREIRIRTVPPENMHYSDQESVKSVDDLRFLAERKVMSRADLLEMGVPAEVVERVHGTFITETGHARAEDQIDSDAVQFSNEEVDVYRCFIKLDKKGDKPGVHKVELHEVWIVDDYVIQDDIVDFAPYIAGVILPMPHRLEGQGIFPLLKNIQDSKTVIVREYLDNLSIANLNRVGAVEGQVNMSDLTNGRKNGVVRMRSPDALLPLPYADIGPQVMAGLQYMDKIRTDRIGTSIDFNEVNAQIMQSSAVAAMGTIANAEKMVALYARNFVETLLKPLFLMVHRVMRESDTPVFVKHRDQWVQQVPSHWLERKHAASLMGLTTIEKATRLNALNGVVQTQQMLYQAGADDVLVDLNNVYNALMDQLRAQDINTPEDYYSNPISQEAQQAIEQKVQAAQAQEQQMFAMQQQLEQMKQEFELEKQKRDLEYKVWADQQKADLEEAKMIHSKNG